MLACHTYRDIRPPAAPAGVGSNDDLARTVFCDAVWNAIQAEALLQAEGEPVLRPMIERAVLHRSSIGEGISMLLGHKLSDGIVEPANLYEEFRNVVADNPSISTSTKRDLLTTRETDPAVTSLLHPFLNFKGLLATQAYRVAHALWKAERRSLAYFVQNRASEVFGADIHPAARIGSGVVIDHGTGVVIGETAVVGNDVTILHGVTLGGTGNEGGDRHPKIGNDVFIGAGAQLLGNIRIGEGSRIGASSVVLKDVEAHSTVAGVPARVVRRRPQSTIPLPTFSAASR